MCSTACPRCQQGGGPWYQTRTCFLGSDCHCPGSRVSPGDCICHRPSWGRASQYVQCHPRTTTASMCLSAPVQYPHAHIHPHLLVPAGRVPTLPSPMTAGERSSVPLDKVPAAVGEPAGYQSPERWGRGGIGSSSNSLTHRALRRHLGHLWSPLVLSISGWKPPEVQGT